LVFFLLASATFISWTLHERPRTGIDDANIFFSYAENLAAGNGMSYARNGEPVEGFTSMLWMLLCALSFTIGLDEAGVFVLSFLLFTATQFLMLKAIQEGVKKPNDLAGPLQLIYFALILSSPAYITWMTITLMDTCLWGFLVSAMAFLLVSPPKSRRTYFLTALVFGMAPLARPEAFLAVPLMTGLLWLRCRTCCPGQTRRVLSVCLLPFAVSVSGLTCFRMVYFGYPLPNTFYAKVSPSIFYNLKEGTEYLYYFLQGNLLFSCSFLLLFCISAAWLGQWLRKFRSRSGPGSFLPEISAAEAVSFSALILLAIPVLTGGDHFKMYRFFQPATPLIFLSILLSAENRGVVSYDRLIRLREGCRTNMLSGVLVSSVTVMWLLTLSSQFSWGRLLFNAPILFECRLATWGIRTGTLLNEIFYESNQKPRIGIGVAGGIARTYQGHIVDLLGLNNVAMAHSDGDRKGLKNHAAFQMETFWSVQPDLILLPPPVPPESHALYPEVFPGLLDDFEFIRRWHYGIFFHKNNPEDTVQGFVQKSFLEQLSPLSGVEFQETVVWSGTWVPIEQEKER
jgi:hypothetical protein